MSCITMIEIIEHKDYNKPADNETVVEVDGPKGIKTKLFKVFDGIWLNPNPVITTEKEAPEVFLLPPYYKDYCKTTEQKSKYLEQMTILFKRINSVPLGQALLTELHKGAPINFSNKYIWNKSNMVTYRTKDNLLNKKLRATCIIIPRSGYLENSATIQSFFKPGYINSTRLEVHFNPDCIYSLRTQNIINYVQPDIVLYHELLHIVHSIYNILGQETLDEEFITFGDKDALPYLDPNLNYYKNTRDTLFENLNLLKIHINAIQDLTDKKFFQEKYGFTNNSVIDDTFVHNYIKRYQCTLSEYNYTQQLDIKGNHRAGYKDVLFLGFKFDISDPYIYTIEKGLTVISNTLEEIQNNPLNILTNIDCKEVFTRLNLGKSKS